MSKKSAQPEVDVKYEHKKFKKRAEEITTLRGLGRYARNHPDKKTDHLTVRQRNGVRVTAFAQGGKVFLVRSGKHVEYEGQNLDPSFRKGDPRHRKTRNQRRLP